MRPPADRRTALTVAVIVPVRDRPAEVATLLAALAAGEVRPDEVVVVDDGSSPPLRLRVDGLPLRVPRHERPAGPAAARNLGAGAAASDVLLFLDSDVVPESDLVRRVREVFAGEDAPDAAFGTYVPVRSGRGLVAEWKDLSIAFLHLTAPREATTFWAACGAVRSEAFAAAGGFDPTRFRRPSVEDIDLGFRLAARGFRIHCRPELRVRHTKRWTLPHLVLTDVRDRAIPWAALQKERGVAGDRLHLRPRRRASALLACASLALLLLAPIAAGAATAAAGVCLLLAAAASAPEIRFYAKQGGARFALAALPLHLFYLVYAAAGFAIGRLLPRRPPTSRGCR